jgi:hypothetical protein
MVAPLFCGAQYLARGGEENTAIGQVPLASFVHAMDDDLLAYGADASAGEFFCTRLRCAALLDDAHRSARRRELWRFKRKSPP